MYLNPAETVIQEFGGVRKTAKILKLYPSTVCRWKTSKGLIPSAMQTTVLKEAKRLNKNLTTDDIVWGRTVK